MIIHIRIFFLTCQMILSSGNLNMEILGEKKVTCLVLSVTQLCLTLCDPPGLQSTKLLCPWDFPGKNTGVGCHFLLQGIFPTQGLNLCLLRLLHQQANSLPLHHLYYKATVTRKMRYWSGNRPGFSDWYSFAPRRLGSIGNF